MAATFDWGLGRALDRLRFAVGDTEVAEALLPDESYEAALAMYDGDERRATLVLAEGLIARYAREPEKVVVEDSRVEVSWKERLAGWTALVARLRAELSGSHGGTRRPERRDERKAGAEYRAEGRAESWGW
jgi:hypothetical protein